jgi:membrane protease YdiL (CAAX protease family)
MRPARSLLIYTVVVFAGGALIAPWLYWLAQSVAPHSHTAQSPFHRFLDRSFLGLALLGIWPLMRSLGAKSARDVGLVKPGGQWNLLVGGFALGYGSLAAAAALALATHARTINGFGVNHELLPKIAEATATAIIVAVLEEILFRGAIFGALRKTWNLSTALLVSSMIYAIVHFIAKADLPGPVTWNSGFRLLPLMFGGFANLPAVIAAFFNLTLAGVLLGLAYQRTGNLYFSIGLHAGWIFWLRFYGFLTLPAPHANLRLWGTDKLIDGWIAFAVLAVALSILMRMLPAKPKPVSP